MDSSGDGTCEREAAVARTRRSIPQTPRKAVAGLAAGLAAIASATAVAPAGAVELAVHDRAGGAAAKRAVERYWTPARMSAARPLGAVRTGRGEVRLRRGPKQPFNHPPPPFESAQVPDPGVAPNTVNGKIYGKIDGIGKYTCSGTIVDSPSRSLMMTAGHCVAERGYGTASKVVFVPAYAEGHRPFGTWVFNRIVTLKSWRKRGNFNYDFAGVVMAPLNGVALQDAVGAAVPLATNLPPEQTYVATGYPANRLDSEAMWRCTGAFAGFDPRPIPNGPDPIAMGCDMNEGASGGGWQVNGHLNSVSSFGYGDHPDVLFGPYFGNKTRELYDAVANG
jgi:hypothetical protein